MRKLLAMLFIIYSIGSLGQVLAAETYTWQGILEAGQTLYISDNYLNASIAVLPRPVALIKVNAIPYFLANGTVIIGRMNVTVVPLNESTMSIIIRSSEPFSATFWPVVVTRTVIVNQTNETLIKELQVLVNQLNATLQEKEALIQNLTLELEKAQALNSEKEELIQNLSHQIKDLQNQITILEQQNAEAKANNSLLVENNTLLLARVENLTKALNASRALIEQLNSTLHEKDIIIENLTSQIKVLTEENGKLRGQVSELEGRLRASNLTVLQARLLNLTKENRELKAELANLTTKYNQLKAKADFLEQQNEEYRQIIQQVMMSESEQSKQSYIEKAKKERLIGSVLWKSFLSGLVVVGLVGYGLYRIKRRHEFAGL